MNFDAAVRGLAMGDMYSPQSGIHRLNLVGERRVRRFQILGNVASSMRHSTRPSPYVNGYPQQLLKPRPSDDCEWFYFARNIALNHLSFEEEWKKLAEIRESLLARAGTHAALRNIHSGKLAPHSGHDNTHYFDSISLIHALAIASIPELSGDELHRILLEDISHTHSEDGIWCAQALAEFIFQLRTGSSIDAAIPRALNFLPMNSWSLREVQKALALSDGLTQELDRVFDLEEYFVDRIYAFPYGAPETLGLLLSHLRYFQDPHAFFTISFLHSRHTDALPPLMGFFAGLLGGDEWMPNHLRTQTIELDGVCIPSLKGKRLI